MGRVVRFHGNSGSGAANDDLSLTDRLAACLADIVDEPLQLLNDPSPGRDQLLELRLAHFNSELADRAAALLEEAGW